MVNRDQLKKRIKAKLLEIERDGKNIGVNSDNELELSGSDTKAKLYRAVRGLEEAIETKNMSPAARSIAAAIRQHISGKFDPADESDMGADDYEERIAGIKEVVRQLVLLMRNDVDSWYAPLNDMTGIAREIDERVYRNIATIRDEADEMGGLTELPSVKRSVDKILGLAEQVKDIALTINTATAQAANLMGDIMNEIDDVTLKALR